MGTEIHLHKHDYHTLDLILVKLNNPLMGTETLSQLTTPLAFHSVAY